MTSNNKKKLNISVKNVRWGVKPNLQSNKVETPWTELRRQTRNINDRAERVITRPILTPLPKNLGILVKKPTKLSLFTGNPYLFVVLIRLELETILPTQ